MSSTSPYHLVSPRTALFPISLCFLLLFLFTSASAEPLVLDKGIIEQDTTWQGEILIKGDIEVAKDATLTIMPGSVIKFAKIEEFGPQKLSLDKLSHFPRAELIIRGRLYAQGTLENKIIFTSAEQAPHAGDWGSINFLGSEDSIVEFCKITYAHTGVHAHSAKVIVSYCTFHHNGVAIGQKNLKNGQKSVVPMLYNRITDNGGGILYGGGSTPIIAHNEINNNTFFGIYAKKGGLASIRYNNITANGKGVIFFKIKNIVLRDNNISGNLDYNISMLEGQSGDITAPGNWWGTTDPEAIRKAIRDKERDAELGRFDASSPLPGKVAGAGLVW